MSKTSYLLIVILVILIGAYIYFRNTTLLHPNVPVFNKKSAQAKQVVEGTLSLSPTNQTLLAGQSAAIDIAINTQDATPTLIQFELAYDPSVLTPSQIVPGKYFLKPIELLNRINPNNGRISYALQCPTNLQNGTSNCVSNPSASVAKVLFTINPIAAKAETTINILPKTLLETAADTQVVLKTTNAKILLRGVQQTASPSAVIITP